MPADERTDVAVVGLGPIGRRIAARLLDHPRIRIVGAADIDPALVGEDLGEVAGHADRPTVKIVGSLDLLPPGPGVAMLMTASRLRTIAAQVETLAAKGWNVLSTAEELCYPDVADHALAQNIDERARSCGVSVLGAGINPGFLLDTLVLALRYACVRVDGVRVQRKLDTNHRRVPLQAKAGVGMTKADFEAAAQEGKVGHVGLVQSAHLLASGLGWRVTEYTETIEPVLADVPVQTGLGVVAVGQVIGQHQHAVLSANDGHVIDYDLWMHAGCTGVDRIMIDGEPPLSQIIEGGVNGDIGTEAVVTNLVTQLPQAHPGLLTMAELVALR